MKCARLFRPLVVIAIAVACASVQDVLHAAGGPNAAAAASAATSTPLKVDRLDSSIDQIIPAGAVLECVTTGFKWLEGPVWTNGSLYFADIPGNSIRKWTPGKGVTTLLTPSGYKGSTPYSGPESGSNGMTLDAHGRLTVAGHAQRDVYRLESLQPGAPATILADNYHGQRFNSPNDLVYKSDGSLYFTDPPYGLRTQQDSDPEKQLKVNGVYRIPHALEQKPGAVPARADLQLLTNDLPGRTASPSLPTKNTFTSITPSRRRYGCATACCPMEH